MKRKRDSSKKRTLCKKERKAISVTKDEGDAVSLTWESWGGKTWFNFYVASSVVVAHDNFLCFYRFSVPSWRLSSSRISLSGLFPHPPQPPLQRQKKMLASCQPAVGTAERLTFYKYRRPPSKLIKCDWIWNDSAGPSQLPHPRQERCYSGSSWPSAWGAAGATAWVDSPKRSLRFQFGSVRNSESENLRRCCAGIQFPISQIKPPPLFVV